MTTNPLRAARGTTAALGARALLDGELAKNTDTERLHIGDATTLGGLPIALYSDIPDSADTVTFRRVIATTGSLVNGSEPSWVATQTWLDNVFTYIASTIDVTGGSNGSASSLLARWRVDGATQFSVGKGGNLFFAGSIDGDLSDGEVTATGSTTARSLENWLGDIQNVVGHGATDGGLAAALLTAFQAAIDALPAGGGKIICPEGDYSALVPGSLTVGSKAVTFVSIGATLPTNMPGAVLGSGVFSLPETSQQANRSTRVHDLRVFDNSLATTATRQHCIHLEGFLPDDGGTDDLEFRGYSFDLGTDGDDPDHNVYGVKGRVYADGGQSTVRGVYGVGDSYGGHTGTATGVIGTVIRDGSQTNEIVAVRGHVQPGSSTSNSIAFQAAGNGADRSCSIGFSVRGGSGGALNCVTACFDAHGGGGGDLFRGTVSASDSTVCYRVLSTGQVVTPAARTASVTVADDAVTSITPPSTAGGMVFIYTANVANAYAVAFFRASGTHILANAGTLGAGMTLTAGSTPTGTTGGDGTVNVFCNAGQIHIENRNGASRSFTYFFMSG